MATKSEIEKWIESAKNKRTRYQKIVRNCDDEIARLEPVYRELGAIKSDFSSVRKNTLQIIDEKRKWVGDKHNAFCQAGDSFDNVCGDYYRLLDAAQDAVNTKIGDLKAQKRELVPLIGNLWGQIERWKVDLQNIGN